MELTDQQQAVCDAPGNFLLLACPGSGKTRSAAARFGQLAESGRKVAICSYTNVGADRIAHVIADMGFSVDAQHFHGTLHRFLLRYVVYPFAATAGLRGPVRLIENSGRSVAYAGNNQRRVDVDAFRRRPDGSLKLTRRPIHLSTVPDDDLIANVGSTVLWHKEQLLQDGKVTFDDAIYLALQVLRENDTIARAVAGRFDELLVDEAQDTSELQLACVDALKSTGQLSSLVLVGDLEQSIFEFQGASAAGCRRVAGDYGLTEIRLTQNHRCSQRICDVAVHFCDRTEPDEAVGPHADCPIDPEVVLYPPDAPRDAIRIFRDRLEAHDADPAQGAVLARSNALVDELNGDQSPVPIADRPRRVGIAVAALRNGTLTRRQLEAVERIVAFTAWDDDALERLDANARQQLRQATIHLLDRAPALEHDLREWIQQAAVTLRDATSLLVDRPAHAAGRILSSRAEQSETIASDAFIQPPRLLGAQTVHDIKGEDRDSILVVLDRPRSRRRDDQASLWSSALAGDELAEEQAEERRIAFVALTRAVRICVVALPDDTSGRAAATTFVARGFRFTDSSGTA
jgi:superfamily I DNA/RNA helicase